MRGMASMSATYSIAFCGTQPPACCWARHRTGITAEASRPCGYLAISRFVQARFSAVKANSFGWIAASARRRTDITMVQAMPRPERLSPAGRVRCRRQGARFLYREYLAHYADGAPRRVSPKG